MHEKTTYREMISVAATDKANRIREDRIARRESAYGRSKWLGAAIDVLEVGHVFNLLYEDIFRGVGDIVYAISNRTIRSRINTEVARRKNVRSKFKLNAVSGNRQRA